MNISKQKLVFVEVFVLVICYVVGLNFFLFVKTLGEPIIGDSWLKENEYMVSSLSGISIGLIMAYFEFNVFPKLARLSYLYFIFLKFLVITLAIILSVLIVAFLSHAARGIIFSETIHFISSFFSTDFFLSILIYVIIYSFLLSIIRIVSIRVGPGAFLDFLTGKYRMPTEEDRVFMFLDLRSSTYLAEKLGHVKYSRLLNKCFNDLTDLLDVYKAEIYQFVGDEVVLTWKSEKSKYDLPFVEVYRTFAQRLFENRQDYLDKFGVYPKFKASIHSGLVTVTEIRSRKHELVYHGDVLNTCSRILELCTRLEKDLLISEKVASWIIENKGYKVKQAGNIVLRGKQNPSLIFEIINIARLRTPLEATQ